MSELAPADRRWLDAAVRFARPHLGTTAGHPVTAALIVDEEAGIVFGRGVTGAAGRPYAEIAAVGDARGNTAGRTLYITLEPNGEMGPLPSEAEILIDAEVARAVIGIEHPDRNKRGRGVAAFRAAGVDVVVADHAPSRELHEAFAHRAARGLPFVTAILGMSSDGMIANKDGAPIDLLSPPARRWVEFQRGLSDAVMIGARTARFDDRTLDPAVDGFDDRPYLRVLIAGTQPLAPDLAVLQSPRSVIVAPKDAALPASVAKIEVEARNGRVDLRQAMLALAARGASAVQLEGGARLTEAMIAAELVNRLHLIQSANSLGSGGLPATPLGGIDGRLRAAGFVEKQTRLLGDDLLRTFEPGL